MLYVKLSSTKAISESNAYNIPGPIEIHIGMLFFDDKRIETRTLSM